MNVPEQPFPRVLVIAGSDSGGGAGVQADVKTVMALGGYAATAITAITVQNTVGVRAVSAVSAPLLAAQCAAVLDDMRVDAVKIGLLADAAAVSTVASVLRHYRPPNVVLDPVLMAGAGQALAGSGVLAALRRDLLPLVDLLTPNWHELAALSGQPLAETAEAARAQAAMVQDLGARRILVKGGHSPDPEWAVDELLTADGRWQSFAAARVATAHGHGTGCTLASAAAVLRAQTGQWPAAVAAAKRYVHGALRHSRHWRLGQGSGPLAHAWLAEHGRSWQTLLDTDADNGDGGADG